MHHAIGDHTVGLDDGGRLVQYHLTCRAVAADGDTQHRADRAAAAADVDRRQDAVAEVVLGNVVTQAVGQTFERIFCHTVMWYAGFTVFIESVDVLCHSIVGRNETSIAAVCRQVTVQSHTC